MLEPRQEGTLILFFGWVNLAPCNYSSNNVLSTGMGHPSAWPYVPRPPIRWGFYPVGGLLSEPCQYIPCPLSLTTWSSVFIAHHNINNTTRYSVCFSACTSSIEREFLASSSLICVCLFLARGLFFDCELGNLLKVCYM